MIAQRLLDAASNIIILLWTQNKTDITITSLGATLQLALIGKLIYLMFQK